MENQIFKKDLVDEVVRGLNISDLGSASIGQVLAVAASLEARTGIPFIRMDQGVPGLPACEIGIEGEKMALDSGVANQYPPLMGVPELKNAASEFIKAFLNVKVSPAGCIPGTGSAAISFALFAVTSQLDPAKDTILFIDPGFPVQKSQLSILGVKWENFDIYSYRGEALEAKLESVLAKGNIAAMIYSNPNNPAWICLNEGELDTIGRMATKYDAIVIEDMAYFCMDSRYDYSKPYEPPFPPTVARYTDNYVLMFSASKIFSYAGQRLGIAAISDALFNRRYPALAARYNDSGIFGPVFAGSVLYTMTAGCTMSVQYGVADILDAACDGRLDFVHETREYAVRAARMKKSFEDNGFHIVYDMDGAEKIGDGFFFTVGYGDMTGEELMKELLYYGISSISISTAGSEQKGIRACVSRMTEEVFPVLDQRLAAFAADHAK